jgi:beta-xylosidase
MKVEKKTVAGNPIVTSIYTADPSAHSWDDQTMYIYASHDMDPARGCDLMDHYHVFSTTDMANWIDEGEILSSDDVKWGRPEGGFMWAPDCALRHGIYYYYFPHPSDSKWNDSWKIGVATSSSPCANFTERGYIENLGGYALIDPCVFIDNDETPYIYYGGGGHCYGGKLADDMISLGGEMVPMDGLVDFHEATWVFRRNSHYYLMYSDNQQPENNMRYAVSDTPLGPWKHMGVLLDPVGCETTHGSIASFKGHWYLFYHNQAISQRGNLRSMCCDELFWNEDGTIQLVNQTKTGVKAIDDSFTLPPSTFIPAKATDGEEWFFDSVQSASERINLRFHYENKGDSLAKARVFVGENDLSLLNFAGDAKETDLTVRWKAGQTVKLKTEVGTLRILGLSITEL